MPRIRTVKPEHWSDKALPDVSLQAQLLWIGIWNFSDDKGLIENDPYFIKSQVFPRRKDVRVEQIEQWIEQLIKARFLVPLTYEKVSYLVSRTFCIHQKIDRPNPSKVPLNIINQAIELTRGQFDDNSTIIRPVEYSNGESKVDGVVDDLPLSSSDEIDLNKNTDPITCARIYFSSHSYTQAIELLVMNHSVEAQSIDELKGLAASFNAHCCLEGKISRSTKEWAKHFKNWLLDPKRKKTTDDGSQNETALEKRQRLLKQRQAAGG